VFYYHRIDIMVSLNIEYHAEHTVVILDGSKK